MKRLIALALVVGVILLINAAGDAAAAQNDPRCNDCHQYDDCHMYSCVFEAPPAPPAPPLSGLVQHHSTPIRVFDNAKGLKFYLVGDGGAQEGPLIPYIKEFTSWPVGMPDKEFILTLFVNELTDMPVTISYDPAGEFLRVVTCYNDGKPYIFTIDVDNQVRYEVW